MSKPWFGAKEYGLGISPKSPEGWAVMAIYVALIPTAGVLCRRLDAPSWAFSAVVLALTAGLLVLAAVKSDGLPLRWRWGGK